MEGGRGMSLSEVNLTPELGPSMDSVLLRWAPSLNIRKKLKAQRKTIKFGSDTSLVPSIAPYGAQTKRPRTKRPKGQNVPRQNVLRHKVPGTKRQKRQNVPRKKNSTFQFPIFQKQILSAFF